mgnify:CR=1 FL=1
MVVVVAPTDLVMGIINMLSEGEGGTAIITSESLGVKRGEWAFGGSKYVRNILNALMELGYIKRYVWLNGNRGISTRVQAEVDTSRMPRVVVVADDGTYKALINHVLSMANANKAKKLDVGTYKLGFTIKLVESWMSRHVDGNGKLVVVDPRIAYEKLTKALVQLKEQGSVLDFGCTDEWLKPFPSTYKAKCWFTYQHAMSVPGKVYARVRELLSEFIMEAISNGRYRLNVRKPDSPVMVTLGQFRMYVHDKARNDSVLSAYVVTRGRGNGVVAYIGDSARIGSHDVIATVWSLELPQLLQRLQSQGVVSEVRKECNNKYCRYIIATGKIPNQAKTN